MASEQRRSCGFRKIGGIYLCADGDGEPCDRIPIILDRCPCCSAGFKQTRGFTWTNLKLLTNGTHYRCSCPSRCPVCEGTIERAGLLWIGAQFYETPEEFQAEARALGISRRIRVVPRDFKLGETWIVLAHPKVQWRECSACRGNGILRSEDCEECKGNLGRWMPGIFRVFKPTRIEKILPESARGSAEEVKARKLGMTPIFLSDADPDHTGSVFEDARKLAEA